MREDEDTGEAPARDLTMRDLMPVWEESDAAVEAALEAVIAGEDGWQDKVRAALPKMAAFRETLTRVTIPDEPMPAPAVRRRWWRFRR